MTRTRVALAALAGVWMAVIFGLSSQSSLPQPAGISDDAISLAGHLGVYAILATIFWAITPRRWPNQRRLALAFACTMLFALSDEWHQSFVANREPSLIDLAVDAVGATLALMAMQRLAIGNPARR